MLKLAKYNYNYKLNSSEYQFKKIENKNKTQEKWQSIIILSNINKI